jgi:hypothetical protein
MVDPGGRTLVIAVLGLGEAGSVIARDLLAARAAGHEQWMREHITAELIVTDASAVDRIIHGTYKHAPRRTAEMQAAADMLTELGVPPLIAEASRAVHARLSP